MSVSWFFFLVCVAMPRFDEKNWDKSKKLKTILGIVLKNILSCLKKWILYDVCIMSLLSQEIIWRVHLNIERNDNPIEFWKQ